MQDHPDGRPPAKVRSGGDVFLAIAAFVLVALPLLLVVRAPYNPGAPLAKVEISLLVIGVAAFGGGIGALVAVRKHQRRRWPAAATGVVIAMSALYAWEIWFGILTRLGDWNW